MVTNEPPAEVVLMLALLVRRMRYEGFAMMLEDEDSPLYAVGKLAKFDAGHWHKRQKKRREAAQLAARQEEEGKMQRAAKRALEEAARSRRSA
jgi:hypothetical protein